jgi:hypothetical protein
VFGLPKSSFGEHKLVEKRFFSIDVIPSLCCVQNTPTVTFRTVWSGVLKTAASRSFDARVCEPFGSWLRLIWFKSFEDQQSRVTGPIMSFRRNVYGNDYNWYARPLTRLVLLRTRAFTPQARNDGKHMHRTHKARSTFTFTIIL